MKLLSRRKVLGTLAGAAAVGGAAFAMGPVSGARANESSATYPWTYHKLDTKPVAESGYWGYWNAGRGCCYGAFAAIVGAMAEKYGAPYNTFPLEMMVVGKSGIGGWGTICGALLGSAQAMALFHGPKQHIPMIDELFRWYESTAIPTYAPPKPKVPGKCEALVPGSVLCHVSASTWSYDTQCWIHDPSRSERCARVTGEVALKAVEILNAVHDKTFAFSGFGKEQEHCYSCHGKGKEADYAKGKMHCTSCHDDLGENHPE